MHKVMKFILIIVPVLALGLLVLNLFDAVMNRYIPFICYSVIFLSLFITLLRKRRLT